MLDALVENRQATWATCGVLNDGQRVFYSVKLNTKIEALPGDATDLFCVATTTHDGTATANLLVSSVRVVCQNTLTFALSNNVDTVRVRHVGCVSDVLKRAHDVVIGIDANVANIDAGMKMLTRIVLTERQSQKFLDLVHPVPALPPVDVFKGYSEEKQKRALYEQDLAMRVHARIRELHETGAGQDMKGVHGSGYGWLNAVTDFATHDKRSKSKLESTMVGDASKLGRRAYAVLTEKQTREEICHAA